MCSCMYNIPCILSILSSNSFVFCESMNIYIYTYLFISICIDIYFIYWIHIFCRIQLHIDKLIYDIHVFLYICTCCTIDFYVYFRCHQDSASHVDRIFIFKFLDHLGY